jgi:hypothetical protein
VDFKTGVYLMYWVIPVNNNINIFTNIRYNNRIKSVIMA